MGSFSNMLYFLIFLAFVDVISIAQLFSQETIVNSIVAIV